MVLRLLRLLHSRIPLLLFHLKTLIKGHLAGSVGGASDFRSRGNEFELHVGCTDYLNKQT